MSVRCLCTDLRLRTYYTSLAARRSLFTNQQYESVSNLPNIDFDIPLIQDILDSSHFS